jgi:hypothetical protein
VPIAALLLAVATACSTTLAMETRGGSVPTTAAAATAMDSGMDDMDDMDGMSGMDGMEGTGLAGGPGPASPGPASTCWRKNV